MENNKTNKYQYLNHPCLIDNFKQTYLTSLNVFLNDDKFKAKISTLPILKSSAITRYEKQKEKDKEKQNKGNQYNQKVALTLPSSVPRQSKAKTNTKLLGIRYIIMDHELIEITLSALEESSDCSSKLTDPFHSYFLESNEKIRKKALENIIANIIPKNDKERTKMITDQEKATNYLLYQDLMALEAKYMITEDESKTNSWAKHYLKSFDDNCANHGIISLDQRIDYFTYLKKNGYWNTPHSPSNMNKSPSLRKKSRDDSAYVNETNSKMDTQATNNKKGYSEIGKYASDLKSKFKIYDDITLTKLGEAYEKELSNRLRTFTLLKKNFEKSSRFIDKLRMHLSCQEISNDKVIIRECGLTSDTFYHLITKKYFDFNILRHLNLSRNPLGDIGGCYLFSLIESYGVKFDYLNVSYTKIGKQSCEILVNILKENKVKILSLSLGGNALGDKLFSELCIGISKNAFLTKLFVNHNELGKISSVILGTILKYDKKIKTLDVSKNLIGDDNIGYMMKGLICNTSVEILMINDMGLTNKSLRVFETTLCINTTLKELFLERNKLTSKGWRVLSDIFNKNKCIEYVSLIGNNIESEHFDMIAEQQRQIKMKVISKTDYFIQVSAENNENINFYEYIY